MTPPITALGSRYGIQGALGRSVKRASTASTWWDLNGTITSCLSAFQPKGAESYAASLLDLSGNGYNAVEGTLREDSYWDSTNGWQFIHGDNNSLTTSHKGVKGMTSIVRFSNASGSQLIGCGDYIIDPTNTGGVSYQNYLVKVIAPTMDSGVLAITAYKGYRNGTLDTDEIDSAGGVTTRRIGIGGNENFGYAFIGYVQAVAFYSTTLSAQNISDLSTAMAAL